MASTTITLTVDDEDGGRRLAESDPNELRSILNDALREYVSRRENARQYVADRYGYPGSTLNTPDKVRSVERRNELATCMARSQLEVSR